MTAPEAVGTLPSAALEQSEELIEHEAASSVAASPSRKSFYARLFTYLTIPVFAAAFAVFVYFRGSVNAIGLIPPALSLLFCLVWVVRIRKVGRRIWLCLQNLTMAILRNGI